MRARRSCSTTPLSSLFREELPYDTVALARFLIGVTLVRDADREDEGPAIVRIIETEAYLPGDMASHAFRGRTPRNASMFAARGFAYVYFIYGNHYCLNVASEVEGVGAAVLIRAASPLVGVETLRKRSGARVASRDLLRGPGRLARALGVDKRFDGDDLCGHGSLRLARDPSVAPVAVGTSTRIGLTKNPEALLRFFERGNPLVSGPKHLAAK